MTVYSTTPDELVPVVSTAITCAASSSLGSAETVTVAGWPTWIFAASLSLKDAVTCMPPELISVTKLDDDVPPLPPMPRRRGRSGRAVGRAHPAPGDVVADGAGDGRDGAGDRRAQRRLVERPLRRRERRLGLQHRGLLLGDRRGGRGRLLDRRCLACAERSDELADATCCFAWSIACWSFAIVFARLVSAARDRVTVGARASTS